MRAAVVTEFGGPEVVRVVEAEVPEPGDWQVRIKVAAAALNPVDALVRAGVFGGSDGAIGLGWDVAGTGSWCGWSMRGCWGCGLPRRTR